MNFTNPAAWLGADLDYNKLILEEGIRLKKSLSKFRLSFVYHS